MTSRRQAVIDAARELAQTPCVIAHDVTLEGVKCYVLEALAVQRLVAAVVAFDAHRQAALSAAGIEADGSSLPDRAAAASG